MATRSVRKAKQQQQGSCRVSAHSSGWWAVWCSRLHTHGSIGGLVSWRGTSAACGGACCTGTHAGLLPSHLGTWRWSSGPHSTRWRCTACQTPSRRSWSWQSTCAPGQRTPLFAARQCPGTARTWAWCRLRAKRCAGQRCTRVGSDGGARRQRKHASLCTACSTGAAPPPGAPVARRTRMGRSRWGRPPAAARSEWGS